MSIVSTGLLVTWILELVEFLVWSCSSCTSFGLVRDFLWKRLTLFVQGAQFQCQGPGIDIWRSCRGLFVFSLVGFGGFSRAPLVLIIVDFVTLVGKNVVMVLLILVQAMLAPFTL